MGLERASGDPPGDLELTTLPLWASIPPSGKQGLSWAALLQVPPSPNAPSQTPISFFLLRTLQSPSLAGQAVKWAHTLGYIPEYEFRMCCLLAMCSEASIFPTLSFSLLICKMEILPLFPLTWGLLRVKRIKSVESTFASCKKCYKRHQ